MAKLTYGARKKLKSSTFGLVKKVKGETVKKFPMPDKAHARNALARLNQAKGVTSSEKKEVKDKAEKMLYGTSSDSGIASVKKKRAKRRDRIESPYNFKRRMQKKGGY